MHQNCSPQSLTLVGVPGIGKSRLVRELFHDLDRRPDLIRWREGRSPPYGSGVGFWALGEIVKAEAGMLESHETDAAASKLAGAVARVIQDVDEARWVERHPSALVGLEAGETLFGDRRAEAFAAWRRFIERLAEQRPTVLVLEDLHWGDDALLEFVDYLVAWAADVQLLGALHRTAGALRATPGLAGGLEYVTGGLARPALRAGDTRAPRRATRDGAAAGRNPGGIAQERHGKSPVRAGVRAHARGPRTADRA